MGAPMLDGKYALLRRLGRGGMAEVFLARQTGLSGFEKLVVIKRILPDLAMDGDFITMFLDEARTAADLRHPNVVTVFDISRADGTYYMAMEFLHGLDVRQTLKTLARAKNQCSFSAAAEIILGVAAGLHHAHTKRSIDGVPLRIVHRDVSPANVLVSFTGEVKLVDFGIAKAVHQQEQTAAGMLKGKYAYMSPEQAAGTELDHRSDQFALGILAWELLTGRRLFKRDNPVETLDAVASLKIPSVKRFREDIPENFARIVDRMLQRDPNKRFASCQEAREALEEALVEEGIQHSTARLAQFMNDLVEDIEAEASLSEERLAGHEVSQLAENFREELRKASGRAPPKTSDKTTVDRRRPATVLEGEPDTAGKTRAERRSTRTGSDDPTLLSDRRQAGKGDNIEPSRSESKSSRSESRSSRSESRSRSRSRSSRSDREDSSSRRRARRKRRQRRRVVLSVVGAAILVVGVGLGTLVNWNPTASVVVRSEPRGAAVSLDGAPTGDVTPAVLQLEVGRAYKVGVTRDGFAPTDDVVTVRDKETQELSFKLKATR